VAGCTTQNENTAPMSAMIKLHMLIAAVLPVFLFADLIITASSSCFYEKIPQQG
jgi:hypothetical protein